MKVLIVGAGIIGLTTAYLLVRRGYDVLIVEREPAAGGVCSYMNGGQFSYSYAEPLASPAMPRQLPGMLCGLHGALRIRPAALPQLLSWGSRFLRNCTSGRYTANTRSVLSLARLSRNEMLADTKLQSADFDFRQTGKLHIYTDAKRLQEATPLVELKNSLGFGQEIWSAQQCLAKEPALRTYSGSLAGGIFSPLDQSGDTFKLTQTLQDYCLQSGRCEMRMHTTVLGFEVERNAVISVATDKETLSADAYLLCAGSESVRLLQPLGVRLPIAPAKGYSITVPAKSQAPEINITDTQHKIVFTRLGDRLRVAGLMEFTGHDRVIRKDRVAYLLRLARHVFPEAGDYDRLSASWAGLRPMTPDSVPLIGPTRWRNLWLNTGHGMLGSTLALGSARLIVDLLEGVDSPIDGAAFYPGRFSQ